MNRILLAAVLAGLASATALAADENARHGEGARRESAALRHWDTNGDGMVTRDEAQAAAAEQAGKRFDALDQNKDGTITQDELKALRDSRHAAMQERFDERFKAADMNGDGMLSEIEASKGMPMVARRFAELDANKDGNVSQEELQAHHSKGMKKRPAR